MACSPHKLALCKSNLLCMHDLMRLATQIFCPFPLFRAHAQKDLFELTKGDLVVDGDRFVGHLMVRLVGHLMVRIAGMQRLLTDTIVPQKKKLYYDVRFAHPPIGPPHSTQAGGGGDTGLT